MRQSAFRLRGQAVFPGIAIGEAYRHRQLDLGVVAGSKLPIQDADQEEERLHKAILDSKAQLQRVRIQVAERAGAQAGDIFGVHIALLDDRTFMGELARRARADEANIEYVLANEIDALRQKFLTLADENMRARILDIEDVFHRLLRNLLHIEHVRTNPLKRLARPVVLVARTLIPSDLALLEADKILGIAVEEGSSTSHVAIIAKALGVPTLMNLPGLTTLVATRDTVILDAHAGVLIGRPDAATVAAYKAQRQAWLVAEGRAPLKRVRAACRTRDRCPLVLQANVSTLDEAREAFVQGAAGIGLLRTEFFYMARRRMPKPAEEIGFYKAIMKAADRRPVTVRLLDLGADKCPTYLPAAHEDNPQLGCRGIRWLLRDKDLFRRHLTCVLSVQRPSRLRVLIPFVSVIDDWEQALEVVLEVSAQLKLKRRDLQLGIMAEVPSVALALPAFIDAVDFISLGTNDLVQYLFAVSREDGGLESYRQGLHPAVLKLIRDVAACAAAHHKPVTVCGEMAADPAAAGVLVGLGIRTLSMPPAALRAVRDRLSAASLADLEALADQALRCRKTDEVLDLLGSSVGPRAAAARA